MDEKFTERSKVRPINLRHVNSAHETMSFGQEQENKDREELLNTSKTSPLCSWSFPFNMDSASIGESLTSNSKSPEKPKKKYEKTKKPSYSKGDISEPTNFVHVFGVKVSRDGFQKVGSSLEFPEQKEINHCSEQENDEPDTLSHFHEATPSTFLASSPNKDLDRTGSSETSKPQNIKKSKKNGNSKFVLSKQDISEPTGFIHVSGVKVSSEGFQMVNNVSLLEEYQYTVTDGKLETSNEGKTSKCNSPTIQPQKSQKSQKDPSKLTTEDVSEPTGFIHVLGVKSSSQGLELVQNSSQVDPQIQSFFKLPGFDLKAITLQEMEDSFMKLTAGSEGPPEEHQLSISMQDGNAVCPTDLKL